MATLLIETGKLKGRQLILPESEKEFMIGREEGCQIRLAFDDVSPRHCALHVTAAGTLVRDLGSGKGTFVNGKPISNAVLLAPGDVLRIGLLVLRVPSEKEAAAGLDGAIDDWLAEGDKQSGTPFTKATTLVNTPASAGGVPPKPTVRTVREFKSVAEEAQEIIRRHFGTLPQRDQSAS
jgi:pSer/pThr/pTyr-binding forkhead associated (FHA) protein